MTGCTRALDIILAEVEALETRDLLLILPLHMQRPRDFDGRRLRTCAYRSGKPRASNGQKITVMVTTSV